MADATPISLAEELVRIGNDRGATMRALGGVAVALRCPSARTVGQFSRSYSDIDVVTSRRGAKAAAGIAAELGYVPEERFNTYHGHLRMMFDHTRGVHLDMFVEDFVMCHRLELGPRLEIHEATVSLADLLLTKLQVAELNEKDVTDLAALLLDHELTSDETGINVDYVRRLTSRDWGWWRTTSGNLESLTALLQTRLAKEPLARVSGAVRVLAAAIDGSPKGLKWRTRAVLGDRVPWREEPEESRQ